MSTTIDPDLVMALKRLRLGRIATTLPERLVLAEKQSLPHDQLLLMLLTDEIARRDASATDNRVRDAGLDATMRLELWDKTAKVTYDKRLLGSFTGLGFLEEHKHIVILGSVGVARRSSRARSDTSRARTGTASGSCAPTRCSARSARAASTTRAMPR